MEFVNLSPGTVLLNKYRVTRVLGAGGMGIVVCAEHIDLRRMVAIKLLRPTLAVQPGMAERFVREALAAAQIAGDHVVQVLDVGRFSSGSPYMVMEYLEGEDLHQYCERHGPLNVAEAIDYILQAGVALARAHAFGIIHRDIKPANLFRLAKPNEGAQIKMLDFGISKLQDDYVSTQLTTTTAVMGSYAYMSPEQMLCAKNVDLRTDIYALGICLYELLTGTQPHVANSPLAQAIKVNTEAPESIYCHREDVPLALCRALERAYAKNRADRYSSVEEFLRDIERFGSKPTSGREQIVSSPKPLRVEVEPIPITPNERNLLAHKTTVPVEDTGPTTISTVIEPAKELSWKTRVGPMMAVVSVVVMLIWATLGVVHGPDTTVAARPIALSVTFPTIAAHRAGTSPPTPTAESTVTPPSNSEDLVFPPVVRPTFTAPMPPKSAVQRPAATGRAASQQECFDFDKNGLRIKTKCNNK